MDLTRVLGALLGGAAQPPRRRRSTSPFGGRGMEAQAVRALGSLAGAAIESWMRNRNTTQPAEPPLSRPLPGRPMPGPWGAGARPGGRLPQTGGSPWATPAAQPSPEPVAASAEAAEALLLVRAMVAAAKADGTLDAAERGAIASQLDAAGLTAEERDFVLADFDRPMTPEALAREATDPMLRARLYAAAFAGAGEVTPAERSWLDSLARALKLDRAAVAAIEERLSP